MPRPVEQRKVVVTATPAPESRAPQLGVYAPLEGVRAAPAGGGFQGLAQALGMIGNVGGAAMVQRAQVTEKADAEEGQIDQELGQVDPEKVERSRAYAAAAQDTAILQQYHQAEAAVMEKAATELDHTKPFTEQTKQIDQWMKHELGGLAKDPRAKVLIGDRYQKFINNVSNGILQQQIEARQNEAIAAAKSDIAQDIDADGDGRYGEQVQRLAAILGDRSKAVTTVVGMYADHAVDVASKGGDWKRVLDSIPTEIKLPDGTTIPGPGRTPRNHDIIERARDAAQRAYDQWYEPQRNAKQLEALVKYERLADQGAMLTVRELMPLTQPGPNGEKPLFTADTVASLIDRAARKREALANARAARMVLDDVPREWQKFVNQPKPNGKGVWTKDDFQKAYDQKLGMSTNGYTTPDTVEQAIAMTNAHPGLYSTALKLQLKGAASARRDVDGVKETLKLLPAYENLVAAGQISGYLSDEEQVYFENLAVQQHAGARAEDIAASARQFDAQEYEKVVKPNRKKALEALASQPIEGTGWFGSTFRAEKYGSALNGRLVQRKAEQLVDTALAQNGGNYEAAAASAARVLDRNWMQVILNGNETLMPRFYTENGVKKPFDPNVLQTTLSWLSEEVAPKAAKKAGYENYKTAQFRLTAVPGGNVEVEITDDVGQPIAGANTIPFIELYEKAAEQHANDVYDLNAAIKAEADYKREHPQPINTFNAGRMR